MLAILLEHFIIALKVVIALIIPDVPARVKQAESRRLDFLEQARQEIRNKKNKKGAVGLDDLNDNPENIDKLLAAPDKTNSADGVPFNRKRV